MDIGDVVNREPSYLRFVLQGPPVMVEDKDRVESERVVHDVVVEGVVRGLGWCVPVTARLRGWMMLTRG